MSLDFGDLLLALLIVWAVVSRATQNRTLELRSLAMLPLLSLYLLYTTLDKQFLLNGLDAGVLVLGFLSGCLISLALRRNAIVKADKEQQLICITGSWSTVVVLALILAIKIGVGYYMSLHPDAGREFDLTQSLLLLASSIAFGLPTGQAAIYFLKYQKAAHEPLSLPVRNRSHRDR